MVYQSDPHRLPDSAFEPGSLRHLVPGNRGRLLDPRRTPIQVVGVDLATGQFELEIEAFEDRGARWTIPFESVDGYQFDGHCKEASADDVAAYGQAMARFDRRVHLPADPDRRADTARSLEARQNEGAAWLDGHSSFFASGQPLEPTGFLEGIPALYRDLEAFMRVRDLWEIEDTFATQFVRNPYSGEIVKGHRMVLAELGLVAYDGKVVRDPRTFDEPWTKARRAEHILSRLAFVRAVFGRAEADPLVLYRGMSVDGPPEPRPHESFVSATFALEVAMAHFNDRERALEGVLLRQRVPVERLLMSYLETAQMNAHYKEAEAVLLVEEGNPLF